MTDPNTNENQGKSRVQFPNVLSKNISLLKLGLRLCKLLFI